MCVSMRAVYLVLLTFISAYVCVSVFVCLLFISIFKPFIYACLCVCVYVTERETV